MRRVKVSLLTWTTVALTSVPLPTSATASRRIWQAFALWFVFMPLTTASIPCHLT
jgi:hypothetical protein